MGIRLPGVVLAMQHVPTSVVAREGRGTSRSVCWRELDFSEARAIAIGASRATTQPDARRRVMLDPAGHPFCLTTMTPPEDPMLNSV